METRTFTRLAVAAAPLSCISAELPGAEWLANATFLAEEPRLTDPVQRNTTGPPILITHGYEPAWNYRSCFSNPACLAWLKRIVRHAVGEAKTGPVHFNNSVVEVHC